MMLRAGAAWNRLLSTMSIVAGLLIVTMMVVTVADVGRRALTGKSIPGALEYGEIAIVGIVYLAVAGTQRSGGHVAMELVIERLSQRTAKWFHQLMMTVVAAVLLLAAWTTGQRALKAVLAGEYKSGLVEFPLWPGRVAVTLGLVMLAVEVFRAGGRFRRSAPNAGSTL